MINWNLWRKCPTCGAPQGSPCRKLTGTLADPRLVELDFPHRTRAPRSVPGAGSEAGM